MDPERRWDLVHDALEPGGAVALFWNPPGVRDRGPHAALAEVDARHGMTEAPHATLASSYGDAAGHRAGPPDWPEARCRRDGRFTQLRSTRFRADRDYDATRYLGHLASLSCYRVLPPARREELLADTARVLDAHGGIGLVEFGGLFPARRR
ncbi:hypothetical protein [Streptomyces sp. NPDC054854]